MTKCHWVFHRDVVARIVRSTDGGPLRRMARNGAARPTGTFVSLKAGSRAMPWESFKCELPAMELAEIASPVVSLLAQPHRLELYVRGKTKPLIYFPDLELTVEASLFSRLRGKEPFAQALLGWRPGPRSQPTNYRTVIVEVKADSDPRNEDREYQNKLRLAAKVYRKIGMEFVIAIRSTDLACVDLDLVHSFALGRHTTISTVDIDICMRLLVSSGGTATVGALVRALGGGALGRAKATALHIRRVISVDISQGLRPDTSVSLLHPASYPGS